MENNFEVVFEKLEQAKLEQKESTPVDITYLMKKNDEIMNLIQCINACKNNDIFVTVTRV